MAQMHRDEADEQLVSIQSFSIAASLLYLIHREFLHSIAGEAVIHENDTPFDGRA